MSFSNRQSKEIEKACTKLSIGLEGNILEAWGQGFLVGGISILILITMANMRSGVLLHKLILLELLLALWHGTFIFNENQVYGWYLSATAVPLYLSYNLHNVVAWMKNKPFLPRWGSLCYIITIALVFPYWVAEMYFNFAYNAELGNDHFRLTRPWEALARDPWWIFTSCSLIYIVKHGYRLGVAELIRASPRFGILMLSVSLSIIFIVADVVETATNKSKCDGRNPYWKLAFVFKCGSDALFLDDFKKVLDRLTAQAFGPVRNARVSGGTGNDNAAVYSRKGSCGVIERALEPITVHRQFTVENQPKAAAGTDAGGSVNPKGSQSTSSSDFSRRFSIKREENGDLQRPQIVHSSYSRRDWFDTMIE